MWSAEDVPLGRCSHRRRASGVGWRHMCRGPHGWKAGGWKNEGGVGMGPMLAGAAPSANDWNPMLAAGKAAALLAAAADDFG